MGMVAVLFMWSRPFEKTVLSVSSGSIRSLVTIRPMALNRQIWEFLVKCQRMTMTSCMNKFLCTHLDNWIYQFWANIFITFHYFLCISIFRHFTFPWKMSRSTQGTHKSSYTQSVFSPKCSTISINSYVLAFSHITRKQFWPIRKKWGQQGHDLNRLGSNCVPSA